MCHGYRPPSLQPGAPEVDGRLPADVIQRVVSKWSEIFRVCYEVGLRTNPNLHGLVAVRFVIDGGSPQPEGGIVTVLYPLFFNPGEPYPASRLSPDRAGADP